MYVECETFCVLIYFIEVCFIGFIRILASVLRMNFKRQGWKETLENNYLELWCPVRELLAAFVTEHMKCEKSELRWSLCVKYTPYIRLNAKRKVNNLIT